MLDGISAAERIGRDRLAPVVLLTAFSQTELVERARDAGAIYVVKPFLQADLLPAIEIALHRHAEIVALESEVADLADRFETRKQLTGPRAVDDADGTHGARGLPVDSKRRWTVASPCVRSPMP